LGAQITLSANSARHDRWRYSVCRGCLLDQGFNRYVDEKIAGIGAKSLLSSASIRWKISKHRHHRSSTTRNKELTLDDYDYLKLDNLIRKLARRLAVLRLK
jgi:hypothetical protein